MINIELQDCKEYREYIIINIIRKGKKEDRTMISNDLYRRIKDKFLSVEFLFEKSDGTKYGRHYITSRIGVLSERILNKHFTAHSFRHSFATLHYRISKDILETSKLLGHNSIKMTEQMYLHIAPDWNSYKLHY